ncbi:MAG TPA: MerR family transcriptional regulator [Tissierellia bacterium]|nr:MerR family transcriptional regulator [Tissierellia bacterium]
MYRISEFANMTGLSQSKIRFYEKKGLLNVHKEENGYRYFTRWDAFRVNAFRSLLEYGFTVEKAVEIIDKKQSGSSFVNSLEAKKEELQVQIKIMNSRMKKINKALSLLNSESDSNFEIVFMEDYLYVLASIGIDFSISNENGKVLARFADVMPIASCARIIKKDELIINGQSINPSYCFAIPVSEEEVLKKYDKTKVKRIELGKCIYYQRKVCRSKSQTIESFNDLFEYMDKHNLHIRGDVILFPTFLNLDEYGNDIEILYIPIKD